MLYCSCILTAFHFFYFLFTTYAQYYFYMCMSQETSSHFAKYFCDTYSEYITPCAVVTYATFDAIWVMPLRLRTLHSWATVWTGRVDNTTDNSQEEIG
jgi:hypothetical protein